MSNRQEKVLKPILAQDNWMLLETGNTGEKPYPCDVCGQRFRFSNMLKAHKENRCAALLNGHRSEQYRGMARPTRRRHDCRGILRITTITADKQGSICQQKQHRDEERGPPNMEAPLKKHLFFFDFDETIVNENSDDSVLRAAPGQTLPVWLRETRREGHYTEYMGRVLTYMGEQALVLKKIHKSRAHYILVTQKM
ncbi:UNVERIFIED_CONTAM: hypothetical protein FKN15_028719 [Acipenser sinensis]